MTYKAKVVRSGNWQRYRVARMGISVGQPYHEGDKFRAACEWVSSRFDHVQIMVADTLQRHNMPGGDTRWNRLLAEQAGDAWLARNQSSIDLISNQEILRWDDLLADPAYPLYRRHPGMALCGSEYIREEVAVILMLQHRTPAADIYPGSFLPIWGMLNRPDFSLNKIDFLRVPSPQKAA
jgi:hypothetical protein